MTNSLIRSFRQFVFESSEESPNPSPSHEQLEQLPWFKYLGIFLRSFNSDVKWVTGSIAYARGNRRLLITGAGSRMRGYDDFIFYPENGTVYHHGSRITTGLEYNSLDDWNKAIMDCYLRVVLHYLGLYYHREGPGVAKFRKMINHREAEAIVKMFKTSLDIGRQLFSIPNQAETLKAMLLPLGNISDEEVQDQIWLYELGLI